MKFENSKVQPGPDPWAEFTGWTVVFRRPSVEHSCYQRLAAWVDEQRNVVPLSVDEIAWLPSSTYHVTLADGLNQVHLRRVPEDYRNRLREILSCAADHDLDWQMVAGDAAPAWEALERTTTTPVAFHIGRLQVRGFALLVELNANPAARDLTSRISEARMRALEMLGRQVGVDLVTSWRPHITVAYATTRDAARRLSAWSETEILPSDIGELPLADARLAGFRSMADFGEPAGNT